jgi:hypothetical protein
LGSRTAEDARSGAEHADTLNQEMLKDSLVSVAAPHR